MQTKKTKIMLPQTLVPKPEIGKPSMAARAAEKVTPMVKNIYRCSRPNCSGARIVAVKIDLKCACGGMMVYRGMVQ